MLLVLSGILLFAACLLVQSEDSSKEAGKAALERYKQDPEGHVNGPK